MPAIATFGLSKKYAGSGHYALEGLDLNIMPGEVYGFLGPNGAGKSTTIRLLMNFIQPTRGHALILDKDVIISAHEIAEDIGYLAGEVALYQKMTGAQFLEYMSSLQPLKHPDYARRLAKLFQAPLNQPIHTLSKGNRQKIGIIQAFMSEPKVLILDEPTSGLDPLMQEIFYELVRKTKKAGACVFISSHNLTEVQKMCDRVGFIREGKLIAEQSIDKLQNQAVQTYNITFGEDAPIADLRRVPGSKSVLNTSRHVTIRIKGNLKPLLQMLARHNVVSIDREDISLEEEFMRFYRGGKG